MAQRFPVKKLRDCVLISLLACVAGCGVQTGTPLATGPDLLAPGPAGPQFSALSRQETPANSNSGHILFRDPSNGAMVAWTLAEDGSKVSESSVATQTNLEWDLKGVGDLNGDSQPDLLWQHRSSRSVAFWSMQGLAIRGAVALPTPSAGWTLEGVGDFDGDGRSDVLWRNETSGLVAYWKIEQGRVTGAATLGTATAGWKIQSCGDSDGDGKSEVFWTQADGQSGLWTGSQSKPISLPSGWTVRGLGDVTSDGDGDFLVQNGQGEVSTVQLRHGQIYAWKNLGLGRHPVAALIPFVTASSRFQPQQFQIDGAVASLPVGASRNLKLYAWDQDPAGYRFSRATWVSDAPDILQVDSNGRVTGMRAGTATVSASFRGQTVAQACYTVTNTPLIRLEVSILSSWAAVGQKVPLRFLASYDDGQSITLDDATVSLDVPAEVARVHIEDGQPILEVLARPSSGQIGMTVSSGTASVVTYFTVETPASYDLVLDPPAPSTSPGEAVPLQLTTSTPASAVRYDLSRSVDWSVTPADVAVISPERRADGRVSLIGLKEGTATLRATDRILGLSKETTIRVQNDCNQKYLSINQFSLDAALEDGRLLGSGDQFIAATSKSISKIGAKGATLQRISLTPGTFYSATRPQTRLGSQSQLYPYTNYTDKVWLDEGGANLQLPTDWVAQQALVTDEGRCFVAVARPYVGNLSVSHERLLVEFDKTTNQLVERVAPETFDKELLYDAQSKVLFYGQQRFSLEAAGFSALESTEFPASGRRLLSLCPGSGWLFGYVYQPAKFVHFTDSWTPPVTAVVTSPPVLNWVFPIRPTVIGWPSLPPFQILPPPESPPPPPALAVAPPPFFPLWSYDLDFYTNSSPSQPIATYKRPDDYVKDAQFRHDKKVLHCLSQPGIVHLYRTENQERFGCYPLNEEEVWHSTFYERLLASPSSDSFAVYTTGPATRVTVYRSLRRK